MQGDQQLLLFRDFENFDRHDLGHFQVHMQLVDIANRCLYIFMKPLDKWVVFMHTERSGGVLSNHATVLVTDAELQLCLYYEASNQELPI